MGGYRDNSLCIWDTRSGECLKINNSAPNEFDYKSLLKPLVKSSLPTSTMDEIASYGISYTKISSGGYDNRLCMGRKDGQVYVFVPMTSAPPRVV